MDTLTELLIPPQLITAVAAPSSGTSHRIEKPWGHELLWAHGPHYAAKILHIQAGRRLSLHYHRESWRNRTGA
jgi:hypothetical protein